MKDDHPSRRARINIRHYSDEELAARMQRIQQIAPAMHEAWQQVKGDESAWQWRIDGPVYRRTPILGRFRWYRRLRVWWLRRQIA